MTAKLRRIIVSTATMALWAAPLLAGQDSLDYQPRKEAGWSFYEGVKGAPVSGHQVGIELLAVEAISKGYQPKREGKPDKIFVRFCHIESFDPNEKGDTAHLTFKELQDFEHYVLSGATRKDSSVSWTNGCKNVFPWVTKRAKSIVGDLENIGVVVEVDQAGGKAQSYVAPAFLYQEHHGCPQGLTGYRIILRSVRGGEITTRILDEQNREKFKVNSRLKGGMPASMDWNLGEGVSEGWYRIEVQGVDSSIALIAQLLHKNACHE